MKKLALITFLAVAFTTTGFSQKFGYLNLGNLVIQMPDTEQANKSIKTYQDDLVAKGEAMAKELETNYTAFVKEYQAGNMTPKAASEAEAKLTKEQESIMAYEQEVIQKVNAKRQELMKPILDKIEKAIKAVGAENNYTFIFDASLPNTILFAQDGDDVESLVKAKLGL